LVLFENVGVRYGAGPEIIQGATFTLAPGSFHFMVGPSGAGKSSLLRVMYMTLRPATRPCCAGAWAWCSRTSACSIT
jgi:cell division transport system ATP-binding protein